MKRETLIRRRSKLTRIGGHPPPSRLPAHPASGRLKAYDCWIGGGPFNADLNLRVRTENGVVTLTIGELFVPQMMAAICDVYNGDCDWQFTTVGNDASPPEAA
jgi:hypothetical protein